MPQKAKTQIETHKIMTLSTGHITERTRQILTDDETFDKIPVMAYKKQFKDELYGWFIYLPERMEQIENTPKDLLSVLEFAYQHNCLMLCLDSDGPVTDMLPYYD